MTKKEQIERFNNSMKGAALLAAANLGLLLVYIGSLYLVSESQMPQGVVYPLLIAVVILGYLTGKIIKNDSAIMTFVLGFAFMSAINALFPVGMTELGSMVKARLLIELQIAPLILILLSFLGYSIAKVQLKLLKKQSLKAHNSMTKKEQIGRFKNSLKGAVLLTAANVFFGLLYGLLNMTSMLLREGMFYTLLVAVIILGYLAGKIIKNDSAIMTFVLAFAFMSTIDTTLILFLKAIGTHPQGIAFSGAFLIALQTAPLLLSFLGYVIAKVHVKLSNR